MKITTQDGHTLVINAANHIECGTSVIFYDNGNRRTGTAYSAVRVAELVKDNCGETVGVTLREDIGIFENSHARQVAKDFWETLKDGAPEFVVPQPTETERKVIELHAAIEDAIENYGLTVATPEETAIGLKGLERSKAIRKAKETDYWERRNVLIYSEDADISLSFQKWQALRKVA